MATTYSSAEAITDIEGADYTTLVARFKDLAGVIDIASAERQAIDSAIRAREKTVAAKLKIGTLSDADKVMYRQILEARQ
jgi:hypothetical protein